MSGDGSAEWAFKGVSYGVMAPKPLAMAQVITIVPALLDTARPRLGPA